MIKKNIVFITGAGASSDFGFPTGETLISEILNRSWENSKNLINGLDIKENFFTDFKKKLALSNAPSIDIFLANNPQYANIAKTEIAFIISDVENKTFNNIFRNSWLKYLWIKMVDSCLNFDEFKNNNIKIVTFNYDRTLEWFFAESVVNFFSLDGMNSEIYRQIFKTIPIYHVFGKIGNFYWENETKFKTVSDKTDSYSSWHDIGSELKTIYEAEKSYIRGTIINVIKNADEVHFLGFGFNPFNLKFLDITGWPNKSYISGTRYNLSDTEIFDINSLFNNRLKALSIFRKNTCLDYLKDEVHYFSDKRVKTFDIEGL